nr:hypothetical protein [Chromobacterium vaccinii]
MKHAQEPWKLTHDDGGRDCLALRDKDGHIVADIYGAENASRILACVNAGKIVTTEDLERYYNTGAGIDEALEEASLQDHLKAVQQRNQLQATIGQIADELALEDHERGAGQILSALMRLKSGKTSVAVPEVLELDVFSNSHDEGYVNGWNACRDELLATVPEQGSLGLDVPEEVLKDAARWKIIKQLASEDGGQALSILIMYCGLTECDTVALDAAIDKVIAENAAASKPEGVMHDRSLPASRRAGDPHPTVRYSPRRHQPRLLFLRRGHDAMPHGA